MSRTCYRDYGYSGAGASHMHARFMPTVLKFAGAIGPGTRILDVGCGNGFACGELFRTGSTVVGIDPSEQGISLAKREFPRGRFEVMEADERILENLGEEPFDIVLSTEVVEHLYSPRSWAKGCYRALKPGGRLVCTTPYHGYLKNLLLSILGKWDSHANPLWDGGHIKLWSSRTLRMLLEEAGFEDFRFCGVGRLPYLWMTMAVEATRPRDS